MINENIQGVVKERINRLTPEQRDELVVLFKPYKKTIIKIVLIAIVQAILQSVILLSMKPMLDSSIKSSNLDMILIYGAEVLALIALHGICAILVSRMSARVSSDMAEKFRSEMFRRVVMTDELDPSNDTSGMMIRLMSDIDSVQRMVTDFLRVWLYTLFLTISLIVASYFIDYRIGLTFTIATFAVYLIIIRVAKVEFGFRREIIDKMETMIRVYRSLIKGAKKRRYLGRLENNHDRFGELSSDYSKSCDDTRIRAYKRTSLARVLFVFSLCILVMAYLLIFGGTSIDLSNVILFVQLALLLEASLSLYPFIIESIPTACASLGKIRDALKYGVNKKDTVPGFTDSEYIVRSNSERYPSIRRGEETSIIMMADAGAWDFVQKVTGTRNSEKDTLYLNETDISEIDHSYITKKVAYAGPRALTFDTTVLENIDLWRGIDEQRISDVCRELLIREPLDFKIERSGMNISDGEAFKISIARALVSDAEIYIFDNAFILLDHEVKKKIIRYIRSSLAGKTVVMISPNAVISDGSNNIVMISEGKVVCNDTRSNVSDSSDLYKELRRARRATYE